MRLPALAGWRSPAGFTLFHCFLTPVTEVLTIGLNSHTMGTVSTSMCAPSPFPEEG